MPIVQYKVFIQTAPISITSSIPKLHPSRAKTFNIKRVALCHPRAIEAAIVTLLPESNPSSAIPHRQTYHHTHTRKQTDPFQHPKPPEKKCASRTPAAPAPRPSPPASAASSPSRSSTPPRTQPSRCTSPASSGARARAPSCSPRSRCGTASSAVGV